jgi:RNA polymerase sigma-70 factor (ECF subfamily)
VITALQFGEVFGAALAQNRGAPGLLKGMELPISALTQGSGLPAERSESREDRRRRPVRRAKTIFEVFYERYQGAWRHYAYLHTGDPRVAEEIVDRFTGRLMQNWERALEQESVARYAWELFKTVIAHWLEEQGDEPRLVQTAAFSRVARTAMDYCRGQFEVMEESLGLYSAIAALPERQRDVIILRHVMGYPDGKVADILGITEPSVRSHLRHARRSLEPVAAQHRLLHATENEG